MLDSQGVIRSDREKLSEAKKIFATDRKDAYTLADALKGADVFLGVSKANVLTREMIRTMADNPIVFACANPNPEITYEEAKASRDDLILGTGRSDYPNQVNNVLAFPYIFRGALDVRATTINEEMKHAAVYAIAKVAREEISEELQKSYHLEGLSFGPEYLIPKPWDPRLLPEVALAVAKAAVESGVARKPISDWDAYYEKLKNMKRV